MRIFRHTQNKREESTQPPCAHDHFNFHPCPSTPLHPLIDDEDGFLSSRLLICLQGIYSICMRNFFLYIFTNKFYTVTFSK